MALLAIFCTTETLSLLVELLQVTSTDLLFITETHFSLVKLIERINTWACFLWFCRWYWACLVHQIGTQVLICKKLNLHRSWVEILVEVWLSFSGPRFYFCCQTICACTCTTLPASPICWWECSKKWPFKDNSYVVMIHVTDYVKGIKTTESC